MIFCGCEELRGVVRVMWWVGGGERCPSVISSLCRQVAKTLTPNKDSDKRCFGRCVEKNGIIL